MATIKEVLEAERKRGSHQEKLNIILFKEGSFYRAYEWSAWLCYRFISQFKVTHRNIKGTDDTIAFVGFPITSLEKWVPEGAGVESVGDDDRMIVISLGNEQSGNGMEDENMAEEFETWKKSQPLTEPKKKHQSDSVPFSDKISLSSIAQKILAFPLESKSPLDTMLFIAELKKEISEIF